MATITVRLIFVNYDGKPIEVAVPANWHFKELKKHIVNEHWPANFVEISQVERLRLFSGGRELEDSKSLTDLPPLSGTAGFAAVHVTTVNKSVKQNLTESSGARDAASTKCHCCMM